MSSMRTYNLRTAEEVAEEVAVGRDGGSDWILARLAADEEKRTGECDRSSVSSASASRSGERRQRLADGGIGAAGAGAASASSSLTTSSSSSESSDRQRWREPLGTDAAGVVSRTSSLFQPVSVIST